MIERIIFFMFTTALLTLWGRLLWYLDERSRFVTRITFFLLRFFSAPQASIKSGLLSVLYYGYTISVITLYTVWSGISPSRFFFFRLSLLAPTVLGFITDLMLISLVFGLMINLPRKAAQEKVIMEVRDIPWISGILRIKSPVFVFLIPGISGFFEEFFFRGVLLTVLIEHFSVSTILAIILVTLAFLIQQLLQLRSFGHMCIIGISCVIISLVGSLLFLGTGTILPAALCHAAFAIFYVQWGITK